MTVNSESESVRREFGFTNDRVWLQRAIAWREAAVADGWSLEPTYQSEVVGRASSLWKDGYHALILTRDNSDKGRKFDFEASVSLWGPDGLVVAQPDLYDWAKIQSGLTTCENCHATGVKTVRYSFAGRCCESCVEQMKAKYEKPGWTE